MRPLRKALFVGMVALAFLVSLGQVMAADVPNASDTDNTLSATVTSEAPVIWNYTITDNADASQMHGQLDVLTTYYFNVTVSDENGWSDVKWVEVHIWFDAGTEVAFGSQTTGANYRANLNYTNAGDLSTPELQEWNVTEGNIAYTSGSSSIFTNSANLNYTFKLAFDLNTQMRQANDPTNSGTGSYNDANSWNSEVVAKDGGGNTVTNRSNVNDIWHEFGIFQYTSVSIAANWDAGSIAPGASGTTAAVGVTHQSNRAYDMSVWFDTTLTSGANSITVTNINITAAGDTNDDIASDTSFAGLGSGNAVIIRDDATAGAHAGATNSTVTNVQFRVFVPFGTPTGTYTATLTIRVAQP